VKLLVNTAAYFPTAADASRLMWLYLASCERHKIQPYMYGLGCRLYPGFVAIRIQGQLEYLRAHASDFTHVLFTDGWDVLYLAGTEEIVSKYRDVGAPPMLSIATQTLANVADVGTSPWAGLFNDRKRYRYFAAAGYIAEISYVIDTFSRMVNTPQPDDVLAWADGYKGGWFQPEFDHNCEIFQDESGDCVIDENTGRIVNTHTNSEPCVLHCGGGYVSPVNGKDERLLPWAKGLKLV
jgi:hypothetical protein